MWASNAARAAATNGNGRDATARGPRYGLFASFARGLAMLPDALAARLAADPHVTVRFDAAVSACVPRDGGWDIATARGTERVDAVVCALPAPPAARALRDADAALSDLLAAIPYAKAATLSLAYRVAQILHPLDAAGFVVPAREGITMLGCTFTHRKYPARVPGEWAVLRAFHGARSSDLDDAALTDRSHAELAHMLGIDGQPAWTHLARYPQAMPQYHVGHRARVATMHARAAALPGLALAGNAYDGIGLPDCIASAEKAVEALLVA